MTALGRACVHGGTNKGRLDSSLESRTTKGPFDVGFQWCPREESDERDEAYRTCFCRWKRSTASVLAAEGAKRSSSSTM
jgi:hypothetical protein